MQNINIITTVAQMSADARPDVEHTTNTILYAVVITAIVLAIPYVIGHWKTFVKAGKPGWAALIPIYSNYIDIEITKLNKRWLAVPIAAWLLNFTPGDTVLSDRLGEAAVPLSVIFSVLQAIVFIAFLVFIAKVAVRTSDYFGRKRDFATLLFFLPFVGYPILGFGSAKYRSVKKRR